MNLVNPVARMRRKNNLKSYETVQNYCATGENPCNICFAIPEFQDAFSPLVFCANRLFILLLETQTPYPNHATF